MKTPAICRSLFFWNTMKQTRKKKIMLLSVGYGQGHNSAAAAMEEHYVDKGWEAITLDICELAHPWLFRLTQIFYRFCVRRAPWLWGVTYSLTDTADWAAMVKRPFFRRMVYTMRREIEKWQPDAVLCTYPLFAYLLDALQDDGVCVPPYAIVVTDAREISRPWMRSRAPRVFVIDPESQRSVVLRYALSAYMVKVSGFPVRKNFQPRGSGVHPNTELRILYGAYRQTRGVINDIAALLSAFPQLKLTVLAGGRNQKIRNSFSHECASGRLIVLAHTDRMAELLSNSHFYVGKAGAATMFECYAANVPVLVNFTLPGQEQGNLELLVDDAAGCHVESTSHLIRTVQNLLEDDAQGWQLMCAAMKQSGRADGVVKIAGEFDDMLSI